MKNNSGRILIVDDEMINIKVLIATLEGFECIIAKNGKRALELSQSDVPPDLILLDVVMPEMTGHEVCVKLKSNPSTKDIPVIFITAKADVDEETKGLKMGAVDFIAKPFSPSIVQARVTNHLQLKIQRDMLLRLNVTDPLTGIANRRFFDDTLVYECNSAVRSQTLLSLIMIDIDYFKEINDTEGHLFGDDCLQKIAKELSRSVTRSTDLVARYGGEEFVVVLPVTDSQGAYAIADIMRKNIENLVFSFKSSDRKITISLGVGTLSRSDGLDPEKLIETADKKLYEAKQSGRNKVCG